MEQARPSSAAPTDGTSPASGASRSREAANPGGTRLLPSLPPPDGGARLLPSETSAPNTPEETKNLKLKTQNSIAPALLGNALARSLIHAVTDAIIATDPAGYILFMNPAAEQMCGASSAAVAGLHIDKAFPLTDPTTQTKIATPLTELLAAETIQKSKFKIQNSVCLTNAMGRQTLLHRHIAPTHDTTGQITGAVIILHETAETHPSSPGTHHLSHDLNNAFTGIIGNLSLLKERPGLPPGMKENLTLIERSAQKAFELAQQLLPKRD